MPTHISNWAGQYSGKFLKLLFGFGSVKLTIG